MIATGPPQYEQTLVNVGLIVEEPVPELVSATRISTDRAHLRFTDGSTREANL